MIVSMKNCPRRG